MWQNPMAKKGRAKQVPCWRKLPIEVFSIMARWQGFQDPYGAPVNPGVSFDKGDCYGCVVLLALLRLGGQQNRNDKNIGSYYCCAND